MTPKVSSNDSGVHRDRLPDYRKGYGWLNWLWLYGHT
jgi:hypothetical protein